MLKTPLAPHFLALRNEAQKLVVRTKSHGPLSGRTSALRRKGRTRHRRPNSRRLPWLKTQLAARTVCLQMVSTSRWALDVPRDEQTLGLGLSVVLSAKGEVERETGLEPATFSLEGLGV